MQNVFCDGAGGSKRIYFFNNSNDAAGMRVYKEHVRLNKSLSYLIFYSPARAVICHICHNIP